MATKSTTIRIPLKILKPFQEYAELTGLHYQSLMIEAIAKEVPRISKETKKLLTETEEHQ